MIRAAGMIRAVGMIRAGRAFGRKDPHTIRVRG
jgi:hypothetical protein